MASQDKHCSSRLASIRSPQLPIGHSKCGVGSYQSRMLFLDTSPTLKTTGRSAGRGAYRDPHLARFVVPRFPAAAFAQQQQPDHLLEEP
jgi:hypothetical protein